MSNSIEFRVSTLDSHVKNSLKVSQSKRCSPVNRWRNRSASLGAVQRRIGFRNNGLTQEHSDSVLAIVTSVDNIQGRVRRASPISLVVSRKARGAIVGLSPDIVGLFILVGLVLVIQSVHWHQSRTEKHRQARIELLLHEIRDVISGKGLHHPSHSEKAKSSSTPDGTAAGSGP